MSTHVEAQARPVTNYFKIFWLDSLGHIVQEVFLFVDGDMISTEMAYHVANCLRDTHPTARLSVWTPPILKGAWSWVPRIGKKVLAPVLA